jgi:hypothetical protein
MAKLVYWVCDVRDDSKAYNIRARTKKEAIRKREENGFENYNEPRKHEISYKDAYDLMDVCLSEARGWE